MVEGGGHKPKNIEGGPRGESLGRPTSSGINLPSSRMTESPRQQQFSRDTSGDEPVPSRETILRAKFPEDLLGQVYDDGITHDYANQFITPKILLETGLDNPEMLGQALDETKTYSTYWQERIGRFNETAEQRGHTPVDPEDAFSELVTNQPGAQRLDEIAEEVRALGQQEGWNKDTIREPFFTLFGEAQTIIYPKRNFGTEAQEDFDY